MDAIFGFFSNFGGEDEQNTTSTDPKQEVRVVAHSM